MSYTQHANKILEAVIAEICHGSLFANAEFTVTLSKSNFTFTISMMLLAENPVSTAIAQPLLAYLISDHVR